MRRSHSPKLVVNVMLRDQVLGDGSWQHTVESKTGARVIAAFPVWRMQWCCLLVILVPCGACSGMLG